MDAAVTIYEHDDNGVLLQKRFLTLPGAALGFIQDIAMTDDYYLLVEVGGSFGFAGTAVIEQFEMWFNH
eukprot:scaffold317600_cov35-Prasinocladus_malaysianus.AAC.1